MSTKDWLEKDYYKVLGVKKDASDADIKKAFRKIARDNHPDAHPGDTVAEARFKEASEANSVLSDPAHRKEYDEARSLFGGGFRNFGGGGQGGGSVNFEDLFSRRGAADDGAGFGDIFGGLFNQAGGRGAGSRGPRRGQDIEGEVTIGFREAVDGSTVALQLMSDEACTYCHGTGARPGSSPKACSTCQGSGMQTSTSGGVFAVSEPCRDCRGRGLRVDDPCPECGGAGRTHSADSIQVRIPSGVTDGQKIRIKGKGGPGVNGGPPGDLYVLVHVNDDTDFGRIGNDLTIKAPISFVEASLGAEISVQTLSGPRVRLRIPEGTPNGRTFRVKGKGVQKGSTTGDLLVTVEILVPPKINDKAKEALRAYAAAVSEFDPAAP
ncbi:queuine tRNA-ribosyltransferase [Platysternon megacephalum]|uniref:Queuine tRNA-ribosyltransferase n=1 Tax=Platysternon megacephalum TaxID=55544 RepID=A0A4D9DGC3_9SAUR|nr:queuine tRNA-ribosyltransferase [Platysternon megacephalum]